MATEKLREYNTNFQRKRRNATPEAREEYNKGQREWRANNPDKVKQYQETYIRKKAMQLIAEQGEMFDYKPSK